MIVPARVMDSKVEDAAPSRHCLHSADTLETVVIRYGAGSWPEADSGLFLAERQWCTGFWSSQISSGQADWSLQSECNMWLSVGHGCSRHRTPPDQSSVSVPMSGEGWSPAWPSSPPVCCQGCQHVQESTEHGCWWFYWWKKGGARLRCKLSQVDEPVLWRVLRWGSGSRWRFWRWSRRKSPWERWGRWDQGSWRLFPHGNQSSRGRPDALWRRTTVDTNAWSHGPVCQYATSLNQSSSSTVLPFCLKTFSCHPFHSTINNQAFPVTGAGIWNDTPVKSCHLCFLLVSLWSCPTCPGVHSPVCSDTHHSQQLTTSVIRSSLPVYQLCNHFKNLS